MCLLLCIIMVMCGFCSWSCSFCLFLLFGCHFNQVICGLFAVRFVFMCLFDVLFSCLFVSDVWCSGCRRVLCVFVRGSVPHDGACFFCLF